MYKNQFDVNFDQIQIVEVNTLIFSKRTDTDSLSRQGGTVVIMEMELLQGVVSGISQQISGQSGDLSALSALSKGIRSFTV